MDWTPPAPELVRERLPQIEALSAAIHQGGFKAVYRAVIGGQTEALKLVKIPPIQNTAEAEAFRREMIGRVRREVEALGKCRSPEIVKLGSVAAVDVVIASGDYVVYSEEFIEGKNLGEVIAEHGPKPPEDELRKLFVSLLTAIKELWSYGYVHRDIKPANIVKSPRSEREFILLDLGIAFSIRETALTFNPNERLVASFRYLAPEMMSFGFRETLAFRSDLYTTALTVFEYASQQHPLARSQDDMMRTISRALHQPATPLKRLCPDLGDQLCRTIDQMLKKKPALRPANLDMLIAQFKPTS
jgi:eukaryotic-like serine/threonine-protein kinase